VELEDEAGNRYCYRLVGPDEFDTDASYISIDSPMARRLLKKRVHDEFELEQADARRCYRVCSIRYGDAPATGGRTLTPP
jgi:transcription elongation factor GreB